MSSSALLRRAPGLAVLAIAGYYAVWGGEYTALDLRRLRQQRVEAEARLAATRQETDSLRALAERLEGDDATIEAVARERFGLIRDGELLYRFVPAREAPAPADARLTVRAP